MLTLGTLIQLDGGQRMSSAFVCVLATETVCDFVSVLVFGSDVFGIGLANTLGYLFAPSIIEVFSSSAEQVIQPAVDCVRCLAISLPFAGLDAVFISYL